MMRVVLWLAALAIAGCASSPEPRPIPRATPPPNPAAFSHFVSAKEYEMRGNHRLAVAALRKAVRIDSTSATLHRLLARNLYAAGNPALAVPSATRAAKLAPNHLNNRWLLVNALLSGVRDTTRAISELETIVQKSDVPLRALDTILRLRAQLQDRAGVISVLDQIVALPKLDAKGRLIAAHNYQKNGMDQRAESLLRQVLEVEPHRTDAWLQLAALLGARGDTLGAARTYRQVVPHLRPDQTAQSRQVWRQLVAIYAHASSFDALLKESPVDMTFIEMLSDVFRNVSRNVDDSNQVKLFLARSLGMLEHLTGVAPGRPGLHAKQGEIQLALNRAEHARVAFAKAARIQDRPAYRLGLSHALMLQGRYDEAIKLLDATRQALKPTHNFYDQIVFALGSAYGATGKNATARHVFQEALKADPNKAGYAFELGQTYLRDGAWNQATDTFEGLLPAVENDSDRLVRALYGLARAHERAGRFNEAVRILERLLSLDPNHDEALNYLGYMLAEKGLRLAEAEKFIQRALEHEPENGAYLDSMGWVYFQMGAFRRGDEYLQKAIAVEEQLLKQIEGPDDPRMRGVHENLTVIHDHAGDVAAALNEADRARSHWQKAIEYDPDNPAIVEKLNGLASPLHGTDGTP